MQEKTDMTSESSCHTIQPAINRWQGCLTYIVLVQSGAQAQAGVASGVQLRQVRSERHTE